MKDEILRNYKDTLFLEKKTCISVVNYCETQIKLLQERIILEKENLKLINKQIKEIKKF